VPADHSTTVQTAASPPELHPERLDIRELARVALVLVCAGVVALHVWEPWPRVSVIGLVATVVGGWPIFAEAIESIRERRMTMELSMTIALIAALVIGEFFTALVITAFVLAAEIIEGLTVGRGRKAIRVLLDVLPRTATVRRTDVVEVALSDVRPGDIVLINPGALVPVDGTVRAGHSFVDEATITGESTPGEKSAGSDVFAGTINQTGALEVEAERIGADTSFGKIVEAVERAERSRAPVQRTADRYAGYLVYFALACAALTFLVTRDARSTISVIIVAGACGIAAGTPLAILGAIGRAAREGAIIKGGLYLEALWDVDVVAFDKTGTVTLGAPRVTEVRPSRGVSATTLLQAAAIAENRSEHPVARAILRHALERGAVIAEPETFDYSPGRGVVAKVHGEEIIAGSRVLLASHGVIRKTRSDEPAPPAGESEVLVARHGRLLGTIFVADATRDEAVEAMSALRRLGIKTVLLTGDSRGVADVVGRALGIDEVSAELLPSQKAEAVQHLGLRRRAVAMVGDGINDAPALVQADVGIAMGSGTDVARESGDIVLLGNDLLKLVETIRIARRAKGIIRFNFAGTLIVDAIGVGLAAAGLLQPVTAAVIHVTSELAFILNSARLLPRQPASARSLEQAEYQPQLAGTG
jgi:Cd2+/Zn2+-exporting ATPase/Cu+-exporting ATPase